MGGQVAAQDDTASAQPRRLDVITVTATKREESLQDVPISVYAVTGESLDEQGIQSLRDIGERTPNLKVQVPRGGPAAQIGIRGVSSGFNYGFEQSVGLVIDGVYNSRAEAFRSSQIDVSRVEVLRGPQGTLFGKNSTAGLVNIVTNDPSDEFDASLKTRFGSDSLVGGTAAISVPLGDTWGARFVYNHQSQDPYLNNTSEGVDGGEFEDNNVRIKLVGDPLENLTTKLTWERLESNVEGTIQQVGAIDGLGFWAFDPEGNPYDPGNGGCGFTPVWGIGCDQYFTGQDPAFEADIDD
ncbi:MAG: TonB-dependent receptor plug domain-containing protein, partial [Caulobacterales bacterium]|nr:TonB-dependent receptor plug domain-containing protein [Caulobacterales bacterium]